MQNPSLNTGHLSIQSEMEGKSKLKIARKKNDEAQISSSLIFILLFQIVNEKSSPSRPIVEALP